MQNLMKLVLIVLAAGGCTHKRQEPVTPSAPIGHAPTDPTMGSGASGPTDPMPNPPSANPMPSSDPSAPRAPGAPPPVTTP